MTAEPSERTLLQTWIEELGTRLPPDDPRTDVDNLSLLRRFPHLRTVLTTDVAVEGLSGTLPARLYLPARSTRSALVWVHGGAYILGSIDGPEANWFSLELAARGIAVFSVEYSKAIGGVHFPQPLDDVIAGWRSGTELLGRHGFAPFNVHLGGGSAGANLALCAALQLRDSGSPPPASLPLLYPLVHPALPPLSQSVMQSTSSVSSEYIFSAADVAAISRNYLGPDAPPPARYAFADGAKLHGLPPTFILNAEIDSLRASGEALATELRVSGVDVEVECQLGIAHGHIDSPGGPGTARTIRRFVGWMEAHSK